MKKIENSESLSREFGAFIGRVRKEKGITQEEMATFLGITQSYYSYIERGERNVDFFMALKICKVLRVSVNTFIKEYL